MGILDRSQIKRAVRYGRIGFVVHAVGQLIVRKSFAASMGGQSSQNGASSVNLKAVRTHAI
jgi:hypothetical protein